MRTYLIILLFALGNVFIWMQALAPSAGMKVTFLDVRDGDAALVQFPNGKNMLVDAGPLEEHFDAAKQVIVPFLIREGIRKIDILMITHPHADHNGGAPYLLRNIKIGRIVESMSTMDSEICQEIHFLIDSVGVPLQSLRKGDTLSICPNTFVSVLHPSKTFVKNAHQDPSQVNNSSLVIRIIFGNKAFLFTGDAEEESESMMLHYGELLHADVLKVGHHGSATSSTSSFINTVDPDYAIISVGKYNRFNHPADIVIQRLTRYGAEVIRTDENGAAVFWTNGKKLIRKR